MPLYSYICPNGHETEKFSSMQDARLSHPCPICRTEAKRDFSRITFSPPQCTGPQESLALSVPPSQIETYREDAKQHGVSIDFKPDGTALFSSTRQKEKYMKKYNYHYQGHVTSKEL